MHLKGTTTMTLCHFNLRNTVHRMILELWAVTHHIGHLAKKNSSSPWKPTESLKL